MGRPFEHPIRKYPAFRKQVTEDLLEYRKVTIKGVGVLFLKEMKKRKNCSINKRTGALMCKILPKRNKVSFRVDKILKEKVNQK